MFGLCFRVLGSIASIIPEKKNVHHSIILALDSHDAVEVEASIFAADKFSENSKLVFVLHVIKFLVTCCFFVYFF